MPLEPQKSQEACCLTDDDDHTRADDDQRAVECEEDQQQQLELLQQQEQEDEDAAAAVAAAAALTAAAAERAAQLSEEEDDEDDDPSVPKPRTGSEVGAEAMDSIIEDFREGAVRQRTRRKAAHDATVSEPNNSGATITSGGGGGNGDTNGRNHPSKRAKHDTGANSRHKRNLNIKSNTAVRGLKNGRLLANKIKSFKKDEQPSNGGGSGEGSNEPSGSQMAAMGGAAMDNGSDESGEECKSAQQPLQLAKKEEEAEEDLGDDRTEDESPRKRSRGDGLIVKEKGTGQQRLEQQGNIKGTRGGIANNKAAFAQTPWLLMPPPPGIRGHQQQQPVTSNGTGRLRQQQANNNAAGVFPAPADLQRCASSLGSMHSFYTNAQHHFMAQMQEIMAVAMDHHTHAAVAALTNGAVTGAAVGSNCGVKPSTDILPAGDVTAISRACATALSIINNIGAAPGPAAAAAALFAAGGGAGNGSTAGTTGLVPPPPVSVVPAAAVAPSSHLLGTITTLPLPLPLYLPLPGAACAPPHPLQRQLSSGMDLALLHAAPAAATGAGTASAGATNAANITENAVGNNTIGSNKNILQKLISLPPMVPVVGGAGLIDPTAFPGGLPVAAMQMTSLPLQLQMAAVAAAAAAATAAGQGTSAQADAAK
jgi:hypothetical protein